MKAVLVHTLCTLMKAVLVPISLPQVTSILQSSTAAVAMYQVAVSTLSVMLTRRHDLARKYLVDPLVRPLLVLSGGKDFFYKLIQPSPYHLHYRGCFYIWNGRFAVNFGLTSSLFWYFKKGTLNQLLLHICMFYGLYRFWWQANLGLHFLPSFLNICPLFLTYGE